MCTENVSGGWAVCGGSPTDWVTRHVLSLARLQETEKKKKEFECSVCEACSVRRDDHPSFPEGVSAP